LAVATHPDRCGFVFGERPQNRLAADFRDDMASERNISASKAIKKFKNTTAARADGGCVIK
jgi:hypothetical protein